MNWDGVVGNIITVQRRVYSFFDDLQFCCVVDSDDAINPAHFDQYFRNSFLKDTF